VNFRFNMSAGELFDLISPVVLIVSAVLSVWVFASARRRFPLIISLACALGTIFSPLIVFPLYLISLRIWPGRSSPSKMRFLLPAIYALLVFVYLATTFYIESKAVDAYLARAVAAKLVHDNKKAIHQYREALKLEDDPLVHKQLGILLAESGYLTEAVSELRLAEEGGDPDDSIAFRLGLLLEKMNQREQSRVEFERFLLSKTCTRDDPRCASARQLLKVSTP
jgi:tetratricopeptide (TPR) repeat protein